jgi:hypothetical protein
MESPDYSDYLIDHPSLLDFCYLLDSYGKEGWFVSASIASKELELAIPTASNALRQLQRKKIAKSKKIGRERHYWIVNPDALNNSIQKALPRLRDVKIRGRLISIKILLTNMYEELKTKVKQELDLGLYKEVLIPTDTATVNVDFQLMKKAKPPNERIEQLCSIFVLRITDRKSFFSAFGKIMLAAARKESFGSLIIVLLVSPSLKENEVNIWKFSEIENTLIRQLGGKVESIVEHADETLMMQPNYAQKLVSLIMPRIPTA